MDRSKDIFVSRMSRITGLLMVHIAFAVGLVHGQGSRSRALIHDTANVIYRDTISNMVVDSATNNFGHIPASEDNVRFVKHFKYIGAGAVHIERTWTGDPHYICDHPIGQLVPNRTYSITVCFSHKGRKGTMYAKMGMDLSDGSRISFTFTGNYMPVSALDD